MAFKMKGSPMHRNFGIGAPTKKTTPYKDKGDHDHPHKGQPSWDESEREYLYNQAGMGDAYNKRRGREKPLEVVTKDYEIGSSEIRDANREEGKTAEFSERLQKSKGATGLLDDLANYEETSLGVSKSKQQQAKRKLEKARAGSAVKKRSRIKGKRKKAKESARQSVEGAARIGKNLDEKKLFKQEFHNLKRMEAWGQEDEAREKGKTKKAARKRKKFDKHTKKMFSA